MDAATESLCASLCRDEVPDSWRQLAYPSFASLANWVDDLGNRLNFFARWQSSGSPPDQLPLWVFSQPTSLLSSLLQVRPTPCWPCTSGLDWVMCQGGVRLCTTAATPPSSSAPPSRTYSLASTNGSQRFAAACACRRLTINTHTHTHTEEGRKIGSTHGGVHSFDVSHTHTHDRRTRDG